MVRCSCFGWRMDIWRKMKKQKKLKPSSSAEPARDLPESSQTMQRSNNRCQVFRYQELAFGTNNFSMESMIGRGGFGIVYKGMIGSGQDVAVKMLDNSGFQGDKEFLVEVLMLSVLRHENLVKLIGYCAEGDQRIIVYEYMPLGSLEDHLHGPSYDKKPLDWLTRMEIAVGTAKGLKYLHTGTANPVIFRDLKSSNILLDNEYKPKLSDFGLAKLGPTGDMTHVSTTAMGTHGYCDPEYGLSGKLTFKSDIYSFGVVLLELITGHQALMDSSLNVGPSRHLVHWARTLFKKKQIHEIVDPRLEKGPDMEKSMMRALAVAFCCVRDDANSRPTITELVNALEYLVESIVRIQKERKFDGVERGIELETMTGTVSSRRQITRMMTIKEDEEEGEEANAHLERKKAVAEAKVWAESWRGFKSQSSEALKPTLSMH